MGRIRPVKYGSFWERWDRGVSWTWVNDRYRDALPADLESGVMSLETSDRLHVKQGRSTARVIFHGGRPVLTPIGAAPRALSVYLKRHYRLPWSARLAATIHPGGGYSPAAEEWRHLERGRALGIEVPEVVAAGERIGPRGGLTSFLMVAELTGCEALHEALPGLADRLDPDAFERLKRRVIAAMARIASTLHSARLFHKDLYLCHFFLDLGRLGRDCRDIRLVLIDLHRLTSARLLPAWLRWKDLGQLLYSTFGVDGIDDRDRLRFWRLYRKGCRLAVPSWQATIVGFRAGRYRAHNRKRR
jgi:heptose I phosphotransferase